MTNTLSNSEVAGVFHAIADSMEIMGESRFRIQAYRRAGDVVNDLPAPLSSYRERGELEGIPGVGPAIAAKIGELLDTGKLTFYEKLKAQVPATALELLRVPNVGPKTAARLHQELGINSLADLKAAAESGKLSKIKGFGTKTVESILQGIEAAERRDQRVLLGRALDIAEDVIAALQKVVPVREITYAGSLRRARQTIGDLDFLVAADDPAAVVHAFRALPNVARVESSGDEKATVYLHSGMQADLIAVPPAMWGSALQHFTGSQAHSIHFRSMALERGLSFSEHGFKRADGTTILCATEAEVYAAVGLPWIPPELREDTGEFEAAREGRLPQLVELGDIRADLHTHSTWSDGTTSIRDMAEAARARGYAYMAVTDHSAYLGITNGLDGARLREQAKEIQALNDEYQTQGIPFYILRGVEVDITPDGSLALPDDVLAELDIVVASPHVKLSQPPPQATERILRAIRNPHVDIIGHPTGRLIGGREGADLDIDAIGRAAAETGTLLEVNSGPDRLDLESAAVRRVLDLGAHLVIDSDAHHPDNFGWIRLGVLTARRGWAEAERVANTWPLEQLQDWIAKRG
jgi:DNA polymerase (family 10)